MLPAQRKSACVTLTPEEPNTLARFGGDEFAILCEQIDDERDALVVADRIVEALRTPFAVGGRELSARASIGIAIGTSETYTSDALIRDADTACNRSKERGGGRYEIFDDAMRSRLAGRLRDEQELRGAIENDELFLHYQPIVTLPAGRVVGVEALVRWQHPQRGLVPPDDFIPLAEESGLIAPMGEWVLECACRKACTWQAPGGQASPLRVAVNLSARQLADRSFVDKVSEILERTGLEPDRLELEITEGVLLDLEEGDAIHGMLLALRALGVRFALDDFGTGYSSLSYLERLPFDALKLDRSFVSGIGESPRTAKIAAAILELGYGLDLAVVAEGVETEAQLDWLRAARCPLAQGFYFSRPVPAEQIASLLGSRGGE